MSKTYPVKLPGSHRPVKGKCGAKLLKSKKKYGGKIRYCISFPVRGRTRCRLHGGATPQGIASPHYRGKGYSQAVPKHLKDIYEARFNDPELLSLHKEIALCDTRIEDLLTQISGRGGTASTRSARASWPFRRPMRPACSTGRWATWEGLSAGKPRWRGLEKKRQEFVEPRAVDSGRPPCLVWETWENKPCQSTTDLFAYLSKT